MTLSGAAASSTTANGSGDYSFASLTNGSYTVTPSNPGYAFTPPSQAVTLDGANQSGVNFTAAPVAPTYTISGSIRPASVGSGATVILSGVASGSTTADAGGNFSFTSLSNGTYTITPSSSTATFSPLSQNVTISGADVTGVSFTATSSAAQSACGDTLTSASTTCQIITGTNQLNPAWQVISRHGEYSQTETECNIPSEIQALNGGQDAGGLLINTAVSSFTCGSFIECTASNPALNCATSTQAGYATTPYSGTPASWPYITGDIQWSSLNFTYGTVTLRAKIMNQNTGLWPAWWFMDSVCQNQNIYSGDPAGECPSYDSTGYREADMIECSTNSVWCATTLHNNSTDTLCSWKQAPIDTNFHTYVMSWASGSLSMTIDGASTGCSFSGRQVPSGPLFMIIQTQTCGTSGSSGSCPSTSFGPPVNANLPASITTDFVQVENSSGTLIFADNFRPDIYFAQAAAGQGSGDDCADARATSTMLAMDWVPGHNLHLCGALTSSITALGSGASGNPITLTFEPGAYFTAPVWSSAINLNGFTYIVVPTIPCGGTGCPAS